MSISSRKRPYGLIFDQNNSVSARRSSSPEGRNGSATWGFAGTVADSFPRNLDAARRDCFNLNKVRI